VNKPYLGCDSYQWCQIRATVCRVVVERGSVLSEVRAEAEGRVFIVGTAYVLCEL
jgi:hypothetical protein